MYLLLSTSKIKSDKINTSERGIKNKKTPKTLGFKRFI